MPRTSVEAQRVYNRAHYARNPEYYKAKAAANKERNRAFVRDAKRKPCADCGGDFPPWVMDFDHVSDDKERGISLLANSGVGLARIQAEIDKCEIVCANCHRERSYRRQFPSR